MNIETKHDLGAPFWKMRNNVPVEMHIGTISIVVNEFGVKIEYGVFYGTSFEGHFDEKFFAPFVTKTALINSL